MAFKAPSSAKYVFNQEITGTAWFAKSTVIRAHYRFNSAVHKRLERRQIGFQKVFLGNNGVKSVAFFFGAGMDGKMFGAGGKFQVLRIFPLQTTYQRETNLACKIRIFAVSFLPPPPARIAENIDIWRPESKPPILAAVALFDSLVILCARFIGNSVRYPLYKLIVKSRRQSDSLRKNSRDTRSSDTVQTLVPPVIFGYPKPLNRGAFI